MGVANAARAQTPEWFPIVAMGVGTLAYLIIFLPLLDGHAHPIGHDFAQYLARPLADYFWFHKNGWFAIPWFTPAFCGSMPNWGNPTSLPYSVPQSLLFLVDPVSAIQFTFVVGAIAQVGGMWLLLCDAFGVSVESGALGAVLYLFNGFFIARMLAGHLDFQAFMFLPLAAWLIVREPKRRAEEFLGVVAGGAVVALMIGGGMLVVLVPVALSWVAIALMRQWHTAGSNRIWARFACAVAVGSLLSASRLTAIAAFVRQFPRDFYPLPGFSTVGSLVREVVSSIFWRGNPGERSDFVGYNFHVDFHERQFGVSPIPLLVIGAALVYGIPKARKPSPLWVMPAFLVMMVLPLAVNLHDDSWTAFLKTLPIIKSSSMMTRWWIIYIPVAVIAASMALDRLPSRLPISIAGMVGAIVWAATGDTSGYRFTYDAKHVDAAWSAVHSGKPVPNIDYMDTMPKDSGSPHSLPDDDDVTIGSNRVFCTDAAFGYRLEKLPWQRLHEGSALDAADGSLNLLNPACELYPDENHCHPGDLLSANRREDAAKFLAWSPLPFVKPFQQEVADVVNVLALVLTVAGIIAAGLALRRNPG